MAATWVVVADRAKARFFAFDPTDAEAGFLEIVDFPNPDGRLSAWELGEERSPSTHDRMGYGRHAIEPHTTPEDKVAHRFAAALADALERGRVEHRYGALVLVAPPRFLGQLKEALDAQVLRLVVAEVDKDLCSASPVVIRQSIPPLPRL